MTTIRELAALAGVSACTVSLALRDRPGVSLAMREHIKELAAMYHYQTNRLAQGAITGKSATIGVVIPAVNAYYYSDIFKAIVETAFSYSYHVTVLQSEDVLHTCRAIQTLVEQRVEGILLGTIHFEPVPSDVLLMARSNGVAIVGVGEVMTSSSYDFVSTDEVQVANTIIDYLYNLGHREIAYVCPITPKHSPDRTSAMMAAFQRYHLSMNHFIDTHDMPKDAFTLYLQSHRSATALIGMEDTHAAYLLQAALRHGMSIPKDLSIIGCGNLDLSRFLTPTLTTVEQHPDAIGERAFHLLMQRLSQPEETVHFQETIRLPGELVIRESCGPPPKHLWR
jgi:LacI family transcriptional regulator